MRRIVILVLFLLAGCAYVHLLRVPEWTATLAATLCSPLFDLAAGRISPPTASLFLTGTQALAIVALFAALALACKRAWRGAWTWAGLPDGVIVAVGMWAVSQRQRLIDWTGELPPPLRDTLRKPSFWFAACGIALLCVIVAVPVFWTPLSDFLGGPATQAVGPATQAVDAANAKTTPLEIIYKLSLIIGGATAFGLATWRGWCHDVQTRTTAQGHITDRFIRASELLGSDQMASRLGGIFMLWRTGKDSKNTDDKRAVLDMLCAFIREPTPDASCDGASQVGEAAATHERATMRNDVRAALSLLSTESTDSLPIPPRYQFDLTGAQLPGAELAKAPFSAARLSRANLKEADFTEADLTGAYLTETILTGAKLTGTKFIKTNFTKIDFTGVDLSWVDFSEAKFKNVNFRGVDLAWVDFTGASFTKIDFTGVPLVSGNFRKAKFTGVKLKNADFMGADLTETDLTEVDLTKGELSYAVFTNANLSRARLTRSALVSTDLTGAKIIQADLTGADLTDAILTGANLTEGNLTEAILTNACFINANLTGAKLAKISFMWTDLTKANLTGANLTGTNLADANLTEAILVDAFVSPEPSKETPAPAPIPFTREHCADAASIEGAIFTGDSSPWPRPETASDSIPPTSPTLPSPPAAPSAGKD